MNFYKTFIIDYGNNDDKHCNHHIRKILDLLISKYKYTKLSINELTDNKGKILEYFQENYSIIPKNILAFEGTYQFIDIIDELSRFTNISFIIDDIHHSYKIRSYRVPIFHKSKYLFLTYAYNFNNYYIELKNKHNGVIFLPHSSCHDIKFNENPVNKILISGHLNKEIYPDRDYIVNLSKTNEYNDKLVYFKPDYNGYHIKEHDRDKTYGYKYYNLLNNYICCVVDESVRNYILAKVFEILASGSLLLVFNKNTKHIYEYLGLYDGVHYLSTTIDDFENKIDFILNPSNKFIIDEIRMNGYKILNKKHYYKNRCEYIHKILNNNNKISIQRPYTYYANSSFYIDNSEGTAIAEEATEPQNNLNLYYKFTMENYHLD